MYQQATINCKGRLLSLDVPVVMGILNTTPDSFFDGGRYTTADNILKKVAQMCEEGVDIIDVGGMSSRPGAEIIDTTEELKRVLPAIEIIQKNFPEKIISIDTIKANVAKAAIEAGAAMINDISAGTLDSTMHDMVASLQVPYVLMHIKGKPSDMQHNPEYTDVVLDILDHLIQQVGKLRQLNVKDIIVDVGFGFGKTVTHNYQLLQRLSVFKILGVPILVGISRKSMIYKVLNTTPEQALNGTTALHIVALQHGAKILRVHDVRAAKETILLWQQLELCKEEDKF